MTDHAPVGRSTLIPRLITPDVGGLVAFLRAVFDARGDHPPGRPAELKIGGSDIMVSDGGGLRNAMPGMFYVYVADAGATLRLAAEAGAEIVEPLADMPWGDRRAIVADKWGNIWQIASVPK